MATVEFIRTVIVGLDLLRNLAHSHRHGSDYYRLRRRYRLSALRTNSVEELVDIDLSLFPC
jgi:hypothetical protein